ASARIAAAGEAEIERALRGLGDVGPARRLARAIGFAARAGALATTRDLQRIVDRAWGGRPHPRKRARVFQALRMWVNQEAEELAAVLDWLPAALRAGGVVVTLAYHSGEDRIVKRSLRGRPDPTRRRLPELPQERLPEGPWEELTRR